MDVNQNNLTAKINSYKASTIVRPFFIELDGEDIEAIKEESEKLESILSAVDNLKTNNPNNNQANLNEGYIHEEKPGLLSRIVNKIRYLNTEAPWHIRALTYTTEAFGGGLLFAGCGGIVTTLEQESILLDNVTYIPGEYGCAPTTTCMDINYVGGFDFTVKEVYEAGVIDNEYEILMFAQGLGFNAKNRQLGIDEIMNSLKKGYPVIVSNKFSLNNDGAHASLVIGIDKKEKIVTTHDPNTVFGAYYERSFEEFEALSLSPQQGKYDVIIIYKGSEPWK